MMAYHTRANRSKLIMSPGKRCSMDYELHGWLADNVAMTFGWALMCRAATRYCCRATPNFRLEALCVAISPRESINFRFQSIERLVRLTHVGRCAIKAKMLRMTRASRLFAHKILRK